MEKISDFLERLTEILKKGYLEIEYDFWYKTVITNNLSFHILIESFYMIT